VFLTQVYSGFKFCPSVLKTADLRVPAQLLETFLRSMFTLPVEIVLLLMLFVGT
jgi:hypothetical protein